MTSIQFLNPVNTQKSFERFIKPQFPADLPTPDFGLVRPEAQIPPQIQQTVTLMHFVKSMDKNRALEKELFGQQKQEKGEPVPLK